MRTVDYITVFKGAADLCGLDRNNVDTLNASRLQQWISKRLATAYERHLWPELIRVEQRFFRAAYASGTTYAASDFVFWAQTQKYYQALKTTVGNAPTDALGVLDAAHWALAAASFGGSDYSGSTAYVAGNIIYYPTTGLFYQCHTATTGNAPTDTTRWGVLVPFERYVAYDQTGQTSIGHVTNVYTRNPRNFSNPGELLFTLTESGVNVVDDVAFVWVKFRLKTPVLSGAVYSASATYAATQQIYFSSTTTPGNFYDCVTATTAGQSPDTTAAKWAIVEIPRLFQRYLEHGTYSDYLTAEGQGEKAPIESNRADSFLTQQSIVLTSQQQQRQRTVVQTR